MIELTPEELAEFEAACNAVSSTNCWACTYDAAQVLKIYITMRRNFINSQNRSHPPESAARAPVIE